MTMAKIGDLDNLRELFLLHWAITRAWWESRVWHQICISVNGAGLFSPCFLNAEPLRLSRVGGWRKSVEFQMTEVMSGLHVQMWCRQPTTASRRILKHRASFFSNYYSSAAFLGLCFPESIQLCQVIFSFFTSGRIS